MRGNYILENHEPIACTDLTLWAMWFEDVRNRRVAEDRIGPCHISTVFLGLDHSFGEGPPILFETMIFCKDRLHDHDNDMDRCSTWAEAEAQHQRFVDACKALASAPKRLIDMEREP